MNNSTVETLIGAVVIVIAAAFLTFAYNTPGMGQKSAGYLITAEFDNVEGVNVGSDIRMAGIKIGTVTAQSLNPENFQAQITMSIDPSVQLTDDTSAKVTSEGLLGSKFISLEPGGSETKLAAGGVINYTQGAVDIWSLISQAMFDKSGAKPPESPQSSRSAEAGAVRMFRLGVLAAVAVVVLPCAARADRIANPIAVFTGLDKITGVTTTFETKVGEAKQFGGLIVKADVCYSRPATEEPKTTSFVEVDEVQLDDSLKRIFSGWMFAQSPGLNAVEHPIYDVWLVNCRDPAAPPPAVEEIPDLSTLQEQIEEGEPLD